MTSTPSKSRSEESSPASDRSPRNAAEWTTLGIASVILTALAGGVVYTGMAERKQPPVLTVTQNQAVRQSAGYVYVPFEITNTGGETVESVQVIAELRQNGNVEPIGEQQVDFLSKNEKKEGAFLLRQNPQDGELILRVGSYQVP